MKNIIALFSVAVLMLGCTGVIKAGGCPDGNEPTRSISADGSYYVYNCGGQSSSSVTSSATSSSGTVEVAMKPDDGDWMNESIYPATVKTRLNFKYRSVSGIFYGDMDNDGIDDLVVLASPKHSKNVITGGEDADITKHEVCDITTTSFDCYDERNNIEIYTIKDNISFKSYNMIKNKWKTVSDGFGATNISERLANNNPIDMNLQGPNALKLADFNGDGVLDIFASDSGLNVWDGKKNKQNEKNDLYYLSQPNGSWLESTVTHVTGHGVRNSNGLENYSHNATIGDIDNDGDIDIVVPSNRWVGHNGEILCYVNQGDGHMVVRRCGDQYGFEVELGDIDNDGDLDIVSGGGSFNNSIAEWGFYNPDPQRAFHGILLNDGTGNFYERGFEFPEHKNSNGFWYSTVPNISVSDLDADGDLDVIVMLVGVDYGGAAMVIEENIGNGQFRTALVDEWCKGPPSKEEWQKWEGGDYGCFQIGFKLGDFNKDGFVDIVVDGLPHARTNGKRIVDGTVFLSTGKFTYDTIHPDSRKYPLTDVGDCTYLTKCIDSN
tara:strand:- start:177 stop:1823 length:1647 start_codon:yes stop_codon:yes gene_type:complete